jgi:hypothetical protein
MTYSGYGGSVVKPFYGRVVFKKIYGSGPFTLGSQVVIPFASAQPRNPRNIAYLTGVNASGYVTGDVPGRRTPSLTVSTVLKQSFMTAALFNSLLMAVDANGDTDVWAILLDDLFQPETYDGAKCAGIQLQQSAQGGPIGMTMGFISQYGWVDGANENTGALYGPTTFTSTSTDAGEAEDVTKVSWAGTADLVSGFSMNLVRPQNYIFYDDQTLSPSGVASGMFTGNLTTVQSTKYSVTPGTSATLNIGIATHGLACSILVKKDGDIRDFNMANRMQASTYTLYDSGAGGNPLVIAAL